MVNLIIYRSQKLKEFLKNKTLCRNMFVIIRKRRKRKENLQNIKKKKRKKCPVSSWTRTAVLPIKLLKHAKFHQSVTVAQSVKALGVQFRGRGFETWWEHEIYFVAETTQADRRK